MNAPSAFFLAKNLHRNIAILVLGSFLLSLIFLPLQAFAIDKPVPNITAEYNSFSMEKGATKTVWFQVDNNGSNNPSATAKPFYIDVSMSLGLEVIEEGGKWAKYKPGDKIYHSGSNIKDQTAGYMLLSYQGDSLNGTTSVSQTLKFRAISDGPQHIFYRVSFLPPGASGTNSPDNFIRHPTSGYMDQQNWYAKKIEVTVTPPTPQYYKATNPSPANGATNVSLNPTLSWSANGNPSGTRYKVYFYGYSSIASQKFLLETKETTATNIAFSNLSYDSLYYWVVETMAPDRSIANDEWSFRTEKQAITYTPYVDAGPDQNVWEEDYIYLNGTAYARDSSYINSIWWFVDDQIVTGAMGGFGPTINPLPVGSHKIKLYISTTSGASNEDFLTIEVKPRPRYGLEITGYSNATGRDIYGGYATVAPNNNWSGNGNDGLAIIKIRNNGNRTDNIKITVSAEGYTARVAPQNYVLVSSSDFSKYTNTTTYRIDPGAEQNAYVFVKTTSSTLVGSIVVLSAVVESIADPTKKENAVVAYLVMNSSDLLMQNLVDFLIFMKNGAEFIFGNPEVYFDPNATDLDKAIETFNIALSVATLGETRAIIKTFTTGVGKISREVTIGKEMAELAKNSASVPKRALAARVETKMILEHLGKTQFLGKDVATKLATVLGKLEPEKAYQTASAIYSLRNAGGYEKLAAEFIKNPNDIAKLNNLVIQAEIVKNIWLAKNALNIDRILLSSKIDYVIDGVKKFVTPDIQIFYKDGSKAIGDVTNIKVAYPGPDVENFNSAIQTELNRLKFNNNPQVANFEKIIRTRQAGFSPETTKVIIYAEEIDPKMVDYIERELDAVVTPAQSLTGITIPVYVAFKIAKELPSAPEITISPASGSFNAPVAVRFSERNNRPVRIHYTINGSTPNASSPLYNPAYPILLTKSATLKYFAIDPVSNVKTAVKTEPYVVNVSNAPKYYRVMDEQGRQLYGFSVTLTKDNQTYFSTSNAKSNLAVPNPGPGRYIVTIKKFGYRIWQSTVDFPITDANPTIITLKKFNRLSIW